jgi:hypothetical protein
LMQIDAADSCKKLARIGPAGEAMC